MLTPKKCSMLVAVEKEEEFRKSRLLRVLRLFFF
jgi:hypothetical protein